MSPLHVLILSEFFPSQSRPHDGLFVDQQLRHLAGTEIAGVIVPSLIYPPVKRYRNLTSSGLSTNQRSNSKFEVFPVQLFYLPKLAEFYLPALYLRKARRMISNAQLRFDLIHAHWAYRSGFVAAKLAGEFRVPLVLTAQGSDIHTWLHEKRKRNRVIHALRSADAIITLSEKLQHEIARQGILPGKIATIPHGVDLTEFDITTSISQPRDHRRGLVLLCIANHYRVKGVDILIEAVSRLEFDYSLVLIGAGPETERLRRLTRILGIESKVEFLGEQPPATLPARINQAEVVIIPSRREGGPSVLLEALACGRPVVATDVGFIPEILDQPDCGFIVPPGNVAALAEAIRQACHKSWDAGKIRSSVLSFGWPKIGKMIAGVYEKALASRGETL